MKQLDDFKNIEQILEELKPFEESYRSYIRGEDLYQDPEEQYAEDER